MAETAPRDALLSPNYSSKALLDTPEYMGAPAFLASSPLNLNESDLKIIKSNGLDGYIVSLGIGATFYLPYLFDSEKKIKGLVICDVNPFIIAGARWLINSLKKGKDINFIRQTFFEADEEQVQHLLVPILAADPILGEAMAKFSYPIIAPRSIYVDGSRTNFPVDKIYGKTVDAIESFEIQFDKFTYLAQNDHLSAVFANITDSNFVQYLNNMPNFSNCGNLIFLADLPGQSRAGFDSGITKLDNLNKLGGRNVILADTGRSGGEVRAYPNLQEMLKANK